MRFDNNTQQPLLLHYWVNKKIITNTVVKFKNNKKKLAQNKSEKSKDDKDDKEDDIDLLKFISNWFYKTINICKNNLWFFL